jgi:hypothetical protein
MKERYVLEIVQGQDHDSLEIVIRQTKTNSTPHGPSFLDPTSSLMLSVSILVSQLLLLK